MDGVCLVKPVKGILIFPRNKETKTSTHQIVTVAVSRDRKSRTALSANEIIGFVPVTFSEKK